MMLMVVVASVVLLTIVAVRERLRMIVALQVAEASYWNATLTREVAEIATLEYKEAIARQDLAVCEAERAMAQSNVKAARKAADHRAIDQAEAALRHAQEAMSILEKNRAQTIGALMADVQKAKANELARKADLERIRAARNRFIW